MKAGLDAAFRSITTYEEALNQHAIVSVADKDGRYTYVNEKFLEITGYSRDELVGSMMTLILPEDHPDTLGVEIVTKLKNGQTWQGELMHQNKQGETFWVYATIVPLFDDRGKLESSITIRTDITELKRTELALRKTQKLEVIGQLTGGVAHDFNNLLSIIIGNLELMQLDALLLSRAGDLIGNIKSAASRGSVLTRRLLNYSRKTPVNSTVLNLNDCLSRDLDLVSKSLTNMVHVETDLAKDLWLVDVDEGDLEDSIINLAINAGDAMRAGGTLKFQTRNVDFETAQVKASEKLMKGQYVELVVTDNGVGIDPELIDKIFDPYFTTKPADKGSGLGLAMVYGFVQRSQGEIFVTSTPGEGTRFEIYFPRANTADNLGNVEKVERKTLTAQHNETILVEDDEDIIAETTASHLERLRYNVLIALNGDEALDIIRSSQKVNLLFSDIVIPGRFNGYQLAEEVLKSRPDIKLLFATGYYGVESRLAHNEWVNNTIQKPYGRVEMSRKIREALGQ